MRFSMYPQVWETTVAEIESAGHQYLPAEEGIIPDNIDFLVYNGGGKQFPELPESVRYVQTTYAGLDDLLKENKLTDKVRWANAKGLFASTVAESALGLILASYHKHKSIAMAATWSVQAEIDASTQWLYDHKTVAIIGAGGIGEELIKLLRPFQPHIIAVTNSGREVPGADESIAMDKASQVWDRADIVVLLVPLSDRTRGMVNVDVFRRMKKDALLVNVGRGGLVNTENLVRALEEGEIGGAALDVTDPEPLPDGHPLWKMDNVLITPHTANTKERTKVLVGDLAVRNAAAFEQGAAMPNEVDVAQGY
ncbi:hypothetical protein GSS88_11145 [Corynebacterium sp. 3HC-13]|uniref:D-isomer specific 2-hydroxyacid dehydrogenase family protein n=1 Tax=Corynebacterium poyangense TaxID=2684405 RepID=UPI001CCD23C7|nr:D-isomer specific 2-hydroxyacid dehydrogenase family protein [Corynebacterium poyangense]MBZ8178332.1 hypothetical protein [Corynebacterium poyangense]